MLKIYYWFSLSKIKETFSVTVINVYTDVFSHGAFFDIGYLDILWFSTGASEVDGVACLTSFGPCPGSTIEACVGK